MTQDIPSSTELDSPDRPQPGFDPTTIERPDPALLKYYFIVSALTIVGFPFVVLPLYFKYQTLKYKFDDRGVSMSWGILFRKEVYLTYRRIQDIHVTRNVIQRWLGLADVAVQTASGAAGAEMTIEGVLHPELLRDFLYRQMRGVEETATLSGEPPGEHARLDDSFESEADPDEALILLTEIRDSIRALKHDKNIGAS